MKYVTEQNNVLTGNSESSQAQLHFTVKLPFIDLLFRSEVKRQTQLTASFDRTTHSQTDSLIHSHRCDFPERKNALYKSSRF